MTRRKADAIDGLITIRRAIRLSGNETAQEANGRTSEAQDAIRRLS